MKKIGWIFGGLVLIIAILGIIAPTQMHVEREVVINQPREVVFAHLKLMKNHEMWSPWEKKDPQMVKGFKGEDGTIGATQSWSGNNDVGEGEQEIKNIVPNDRIDYELRFKKPMAATNTAYFQVEAMGDAQTKVKWGMDGKSSFPGNIFCFVFNMKKVLEGEFDSGLAGLKAHLEKP